MNCRIQNIVPACRYSAEGISDILLLDYDDFAGFKFAGEGQYADCLVSHIIRTGAFVKVAAPDLIAKYTETLASGIYTHSLESFIDEISSETIASLHLASKRRQVPFFKTNAGRWFTFGYEAGAVVTYTNQTADAIGSVLSVSTTSIYPVFEIEESAMTEGMQVPVLWDVDFENNTYCENE